MTMPRRVVRALGATALVAGALACQPPPAPGPSGPVAPADPLARAAALLDREDFDGASRSLRRFAASCDPEQSEARHRATLLLATSELDVGNPSGSPDRAAELALRLIDDPEVSDERAAVARTLFRLALDRGAADPSMPERHREEKRHETEPYHGDEPSETGTSSSAAPRVEDLPPRCAPGPGARVASPTAGRSLHVAPAPPPGPTTAERLIALEDSLSLSADSVRVLRASMSDMRARVQELEAELERIRKLLKGPPLR